MEHFDIFATGFAYQLSAHLFVSLSKHRVSPPMLTDIRYQPRCANCHRNAFQISRDSKLLLCPTCLLVHHCTSCNASQHEAKCSFFQEIRQAEEFDIQHYLRTGQTSPETCTETPRKTYIPLSQVNSWYEYYTRISDKAMLAGAVSPDLKPLAGHALIGGLLVAATQKCSTATTIVSALEAVYSDLGTKQTINIHLIGATTAEFDSLMTFEEILHLLPSLQEIHCSLVGIELPRPVGSGRVILDCCEACVAAKRKRSVELWTGAYHDYIKTDMYVKPDLAVAFHSGHTMEAVKEWKPTIDHLVNAEHCTLFTTYNEDEMLEEMETLKKRGAIFVREGEKNKWRGMRPRLEALEVVEDCVYYYNQYWYIVAGQKAK